MNLSILQETMEDRGVLQSMWLQRVEHDLAAEQQQQQLHTGFCFFMHTTHEIKFQETFLSLRGWCVIT